MHSSSRLLPAFAVAAGLVGAALASAPQKEQGPTRPRPGLTAEQTKEALSLTKTAMTELRKKTEGATEPTADRREYIVSVELLVSPGDEKRAHEDNAGGDQGKATPEAEKREDEKRTDTEKTKPGDKPPGPLAVVRWYRYFDDITVFSTVDLGKRQVVAVEAPARAHAFVKRRVRGSTTACAREQRRGEAAPRAVWQAAHCLSAVQPVHQSR